MLRSAVLIALVCGIVSVACGEEVSPKDALRSGPTGAASPWEGEEKRSTPSTVGQTDCDLARQSPESRVFDDKAVRIAGDGRYEGTEGTIIARVLNTSPFIAEVYDVDPFPGYVFDWLGIQDGYALAKDEVTRVEALQFGDLIEADFFQYLYDAGELAIGTGLTDIHRIDGAPTYFKEDVSFEPFVNRSGTLIRYISMDGRRLLLFKDGSMYYRSILESFVISRQSLSKDEIDALLTVFGDSGFDKLGGENLYMSNPSVTLLCSRFQQVPIAGNETSLKPVLDALETIVAELEMQFEYKISYEERKEITIRPWPFEEVAIDALSRLHDEALAHYRATGRVDEEHIVYTELSQEFLDQVPKPLPAVINLVYFTENGKLYGVSLGECLPDAPVCKENTFYVLAAREIVEPAGDALGPGIKLWPKNSSLDLSKIAPGGMVLDTAEYKANRIFYDTFFQLVSGDKWFIQNGYLFEQVKVEKIER